MASSPTNLWNPLLMATPTGGHSIAPGHDSKNMQVSVRQGCEIKRTSDFNIFEAFTFGYLLATCEVRESSPP